MFTPYSEPCMLNIQDNIFQEKTRKPTLWLGKLMNLSYFVIKQTDKICCLIKIWLACGAGEKERSTVKQYWKSVAELQLKAFRTHWNTAWHGSHLGLWLQSQIHSHDFSSRSCSDNSFNTFFFPFVMSSSCHATHSDPQWLAKLIFIQWSLHNKYWTLTFDLLSESNYYKIT